MYYPNICRNLTAMVLALLAVFVLAREATSQQFEGCYFFDPAASPTTFPPFAMIIADVNRDSILDLIVQHPLDDSVAVLLGNGDGTFEEHQILRVGNFPESVVAADLNGDAILDLAVANRDSSDVTVLLGNGDGTFAHHETYPTVANANTIVVGNFNGDDSRDLVVSNGSQFVVFLGSGDGTFEIQKTVYQFNGFAIRIEVGDFNNDSMDDLVAAEFAADSNACPIFLNNGDGTFAQDIDVIFPDEFPVLVSVADLNNDGIDDLVVSLIGDFDIQDPRCVAAAIGFGNGTFIVTQRIEDAFLSTVEDIDLDGNQDLVSRTNTGQCAINLGNGNGNFQSSLPLNLGSFCPSLFGEFDGVSGVDIAIADADGSSVVVIDGLGNGQFLDNSTGTHPSELAVGHLNSDSHVDLVVVNSVANSISVLQGRGAESFEPAIEIGVGDSPSSVSMGDFNEDGFVDLIVANFNDSNFSILLGNGKGTFGIDSMIATGAPFRVAVGDVNHDAHLDVVVANFHDDTISVFFGEGDASFSTPEVIDVGDQPVRIAIFDVDLDSDNDLLVANRADNEIAVILNNGDGEFARPINYVTGVGPTWIEMIDVNLDGIVDLVVANLGEPFTSEIGDVAVNFGNGDGTFGLASFYSVGISPRSVVATDVNGDSFPDLVAVNAFSDNVSLLVNNGDGSFKLESSFAVGDQPLVAAIADLNGNGADEIIISVSLDDSISVVGVGCRQEVLLGDVNLDGIVDFLDVAPFVDLLIDGDFQAEADINQDGVVDLLDVGPLVDLLMDG